MRFVDYQEAIARRERTGTWSGAKSRLQPEVWPTIRPSFQLTPGAKIFTIGSCFARNIEEHLDRLGYCVPTLKFKMPDVERGRGRANALLNKYTPTAIVQEITWAAGLFRRNKIPDESDCEIFCYTVDDNQVIDNNLGGFKPVERDRFMERRRLLFEVTKEAFTAEFVVITPGTIEAWYDTTRDIYIQETFTRPMPAITPSLKFTLLDFSACESALIDTITTIRSLNPDCKILIGTSPVPLGRTFSGMDVIVANTYAKSVVRAACGAVSMMYEKVDYFPSFESVTHTRDWNVMESDLRHVTDAFVGKVVARLCQTYCSDVGDAEALYQSSLEERDPEKAIVLARQAVEAGPNVADYQLRLGELLMNTARFEEARGALWMAHSLMPSYARTHGALKRLAKEFERQQNIAASRAVLEDLIAADIDVARCYAWRAGLDYRLGDLDASETAMAQALALAPIDPDIVSRVGSLLAAQRQHQKVIDVVLPALQHSPDSVTLLYQMGAAHFAAGRRHEARQYLERGRRLSPEHTKINRLLNSLAEPAPS